MFGLACVDMKSSSAFSFRILITLLLFVCLFVAVSILESGSSSGANNIPLRERLAAGVMPIRKSYPSGTSANNTPVVPRRSGPAPSLDDILGTMNK